MLQLSHLKSHRKCHFGWKGLLSLMKDLRSSDTFLLHLRTVKSHDRRLVKADVAVKSLKISQKMSLWQKRFTLHFYERPSFDWHVSVALADCKVTWQKTRPSNATDDACEGWNLWTYEWSPQPTLDCVPCSPFSLTVFYAPCLSKERANFSFYSVSVKY